MAVGGSRTLKLSILADIDNLKKNLDAGSNEVEGFGGKLGGFAKKAGAAFAVAGAAAAAYAGKLLIDGVKSAIEDEAAQAKLATTLENVTGATNAQIAATESYITKTALANGITDDLLRPSLDRLVRSTGNVTEAQKLQQLALDISAGSGKSLEAVTEALAKANEGNFGALKRLGVPLDENIIKTKDFDAAQAALAATFAGQASTQADTFAGKMARLNVAFEEGKETVGSFVLDAVTPLFEIFVNKIIPVIQQLSEELGPKLTPIFQSLQIYIRDFVIPTFKAIWEFITNFVVPALRDLLTPIINGLRYAFDLVAKKIEENKDKLAPLLTLFKGVATFVRDVLAPVIGTVLGVAFKVLGTAIGVIIDVFATLVDLIAKAFSAIKAIVSFITNNPLTRFLGGALEAVFGGGKAAGGPVRSGTSYLVGERGPELFTPNSSGMITPNNRLGGGTTINLNVTGAIDPEGTARTIIDVLNNSFYRGTGGANSLQFSG
jgi:hypothetical protein